MVGLVLVSHSATLASGLVELIAQLAPDVTVLIAAGTDEILKLKRALWITLPCSENSRSSSPLLASQIRTMLSCPTVNSTASVGWYRN